MSKDIHYEFNGPIGVLLTIIALPIVICFLALYCGPTECLSLYPLHIPSLPQHIEWYSIESFYIVFGWFIFQSLLYIIIPGDIHKGVKLSDGQQLKYKCNGFRCFVVTLLCIFIGVYTKYINPRILHDQYLQCAIASIILSFLLSIFLYIKSMFNRHSNLSPGGNTGNIIYDFFIGRQLNPRIGSFDLKFFCELRPGLIGWVLINFSMAAHQYQINGTITNSMIMVNIFQFIYVFDALWNEPAILTTMDIIQDGFGFMLAFGDLAWVPFTYGLQARYLADFPINLSTMHVAAILAVKFVGFYIFRSANSQKNQFRSNPKSKSVAHLKTLKTEAGTQLLITGWWGMARHINYFGDWLMGLSWCLPCGFNHTIPYFYAIYFAILLIHRESRDEEKCRAKYKKDWDKYCSIVKYRIVPFIY